VLRDKAADAIARNVLSSRTCRWALWGVLVFLVVMSNVDGATGNYDDFAFYRAASYMSRFPDDPLLEQLYDHFQSKAAQLSPVTYARYSVRLNVKIARNYVAQNILVSILDNLPLYSPYQSVFLAVLLLHLTAAMVVFAVLAWGLGAKGDVLRVAFLFSLASFLLFPVGKLLARSIHFPTFLFQFQSNQYFWFMPEVRGAALLFFFASLLLWHDVGLPVSRAKRLGWALVLFIACLLSHRSSAFLFFTPALLLALFYRRCQYDPLRLAARIGLGRFLVVFNVLWMAMALVTFSLFTIFYGRENVSHLEVGVFWAAAINLLVYLWLRMRLRQGPTEDILQRVGDRLAQYFIPFVILTLGANLVRFDDEALRWANPILFFLTEAGYRLIGVSHILWWMLAGLYVYQGRKRVCPRAVQIGVAVVLVLLCIGMVVRFVHDNAQRDADPFDRSLLTVRATSLLSRPGTGAYDSETVYYQAVANELRMRNVLADRGIYVLTRR